MVELKVALPVKRGYHPNFEEFFSRGAVIAGGYARYMLDPYDNPPQPADVDVWCPSEKVFNELSSLGGWDSIAPDLPPIQIIEPPRWAGTDWDGLVKSFDFTACQFVVHNRYFGASTVAAERTLHHKTLEFIGPMAIGNPVRTLWRMFRYSKKGFQVPFNTVLALLEDIVDDRDHINTLIEKYRQEDERGLEIYNW